MLKEDEHNRIASQACDQSRPDGYRDKEALASLMMRKVAGFLKR